MRDSETKSLISHHLRHRKEKRYLSLTGPPYKEDKVLKWQSIYCLSNRENLSLWMLFLTLKIPHAQKSRGVLPLDFSRNNESHLLRLNSKRQELHHEREHLEKGDIIHPRFLTDLFCSWLEKPPHTGTTILWLLPSGPDQVRRALSRWWNYCNKASIACKY